MDYCQYSTQGLEAYDYLVRHSGRKLNEFCLSYIFTKNDFQDGSLGLAWTASSQRGKLSTPSIKINNEGPVKLVYKSHGICHVHFLIVDYGGVCSKFAGLQRSTITDLDFDILNNIDDDVTLSGVGKSSPTNQPTDLLSRNTGFITFSHQGQDVPDIVSKLSLLHEIGHSLGSPVLFL